MVKDVSQPWHPAGSLTGAWISRGKPCTQTLLSPSKVAFATEGH